MKTFFAVILLFMIVGILAGCGETINGVVKDSHRIGAGVHKIFVRDK
ncbi:MAG: hypothetical protein ABH869_08100 [Candidatus Omnitrophota bacterium]